ncbi:MAG TPA: hypothetical protein VM221_03590 [Armatimonadota bacterium]|nr:hypothetical protein [Armatimonadota bacterium]
MTMASTRWRCLRLGAAAALCVLLVGGSVAQAADQPAPPAAGAAEAPAVDESPPTTAPGAESAPPPGASEEPGSAVAPVEPPGSAVTAPDLPAEDDESLAAAEPPEAAQVRRNEQGEPLVSNVFLDTDLRQALVDIAAQTREVIVADMTTQGVVTADLEDVPLEQALDIVLSMGGFAWRKMDGYYLVGAANPDNPNFAVLCETEVVALRYVEASTLVGFLTGPYEKYIAVEMPRPQPQRAAGQRERTLLAVGRNRLIITAPPSIMKRIKEDLALIDVAPRQIMLEASIIELSEEALKEVGIDWTLRHFQFASQVVAMGGAGATTGQLSAGSLAYTELTNTETATLKALVEKGQAKLRANPRVATADGEMAEIEVGQESYFTIVTGPVTFPSTTLQQIPSGITLRITPRVVEDTREIVADVDTDVRDVTGRGANNLPEITYRRASTRVVVKDGQSIVIGGLTTETEQRTQRKVPLLGDLPLIGQLFRRISTHKRTSEVVIVITPHLLDQGGNIPSAPPTPAP